MREEKFLEAGLARLELRSVGSGLDASGSSAPALLKEKSNPDLHGPSLYAKLFHIGLNWSPMSLREALPTSIFAVTEELRDEASRWEKLDETSSRSFGLAK